MFNYVQDVRNALLDIEQMHRKLADHVWCLTNAGYDHTQTDFEKLNDMINDSVAIANLKQDIANFEALLNKTEQD